MLFFFLKDREDFVCVDFQFHFGEKKKEDEAEWFGWEDLERVEGGKNNVIKIYCMVFLNNKNL